MPGIVYGGDKGAVNIELDHKDLYLNLRNERFHASILTLELGGAKEQVLLRAVNMHPYRPQVEHVDFQRVLKDRKLHMKVPLHFTNAEKSPGVKDQGGVVSHVLNEIDITCFPDDLPEFIEVDLGNLSVGNSIHARDLKLPKGVELALEEGREPGGRHRGGAASSSPRKRKPPPWPRWRRRRFRPPSRPPSRRKAKPPPRATRAAAKGREARRARPEKPAAEKGEKKEKK